MQLVVVWTYSSITLAHSFYTITHSTREPSSITMKRIQANQPTILLQSPLLPPSILVATVSCVWWMVRAALLPSRCPLHSTMHAIFNVGILVGMEHCNASAP